MPRIRYELVPQGLMMSVNGDPTYWLDHKASFGILWEHVTDDKVEILRHGRVEMILERESSHRAFYAEIGTTAPKTGRAFIPIEKVDPATIDTLNRVLAGEENPKAIISAVQRLSTTALRQMTAAHKQCQVAA